jgi:hypothetical protein
MGYRLYDVQQPTKAREFLSVPQRPSRLWSPHSSHRIGIGDLPTGIKGTGRVTNEFRSVLRLRIVELYLHFFICLHGIVLI